MEAQAGNGKKKGRSDSRRWGGGRAVGKAEREALAGRPHSSPPTPAGGRHVGKARVWGSGNLLQDFGPGGHLPSPRLSFPTSKVGVRYLVCRGAITFVKRPGTAEGLNKWLPLEQMPNSKGFGKVSVLGPIRRGPLRTRGDGRPPGEKKRRFFFPLLGKQGSHGLSFGQNHQARPETQECTDTQLTDAGRG